MTRANTLPTMLSRHEGSQGYAVHGVSENFPLLCGRVFGLWGTELSLSKASTSNIVT